MHSSITCLAGACAGALLLACAGQPQQRGAGGAPAASADLARPGQGKSGADGYAALARVQMAAQRPAEARLSYRQALALDPAHRGARNGLAVLQAGQGELGAAIALWQGLIAEHAPALPEDAFLFANLGYAHLHNGQLAPAITAFEKACLLAPLHAPHWQRLADALAQAGQAGRAAQMQRQAQALQAHDARADYALARQAGAGSAPAPTPAPAPASAPGSDGMARSEVVVGSGGLLELRRVATTRRPPTGDLAAPSLPVAPVAPPSAALGAPASAPGSVPGSAPGRADAAPRVADAALPLRLEICNGNGVTGMATSLARLVGGDGVQVVKISNASDFRVPLTRVEYAPQQAAAARAFAARLGAPAISEQTDGMRTDLRVILGHDLNDLAALRRYYLGQLKLARAALARLG